MKMTDHRLLLMSTKTIQNRRSVMAYIVANILSLAQHLKTLTENPEFYRISHCPCCGKSGLWRHGTRYRKSDRESDACSTLNPIPILRFYCQACGHTCSALPECIPPHRWYLWMLQWVALLLVFSGESAHKISQKIIPSRWTIRRWYQRLIDQFESHAFYLKSKWPWLGYKVSLSDLWLALSEKINFSYAMLFLNFQGVVIP